MRFDFSAIQFNKFLLEMVAYIDNSLIAASLALTTSKTTNNDLLGRPHWDKHPFCYQFCSESLKIWGGRIPVGKRRFFHHLSVVLGKYKILGALLGRIRVVLLHQA